MGERDSYEHGTFSWTDLTTPDAAAAKEFYGRLFGWEFEDNPVPGGSVYVMARIGERAVAAMYEDGSRHPAWASYVTVDDVDGATDRARELGANVLAEPFDVMQAGRMATLQDPTGAVFCLWEARESIGAELVNEEGTLSINQLNSTDPDAAKSFYSELFGWRFEAVEGGPVAYWGIFRGERVNGGMMQVPPEQSAPSHWLAYFRADDIDAAGERIESAGGKLLVPKMDVPGGQIAVAEDPHGAIFALVSGRFDD
jgi:predicted enzyme related to lactoylglutathione lyase